MHQTDSLTRHHLLISSPLLILENPTKVLTSDNIKMILLWITLLLLHQGYALISVTTVQLGESVNFTCFFSAAEYSSTRVKWYKQSTGDTLMLIISLMPATQKPTFEPRFPPSRFEVIHNMNMSTLTILKTIQEDEAIYHCGVTSWTQDQWSSTYLFLKGNTSGASNYAIVQPTVSNPVRPGDSVTLQCSVVSKSETESCPGDHSVHWFGVKSDKSHANIIYTGGNEPDYCDKKPDEGSLKSCVYRFSKNVSSSDAGTYYCAVATCGEILFGDGTKLDFEGSGPHSTEVSQGNCILVLLYAVLASVIPAVIVIALLICTIMKNECDSCNDKAIVENVAKGNLKKHDEWIYSAAIFTMVKPCRGETRDAKSMDRERIYAAAKAFGLD